MSLIPVLQVSGALEVFEDSCNRMLTPKSYPPNEIEIRNTKNHITSNRIHYVSVLYYEAVKSQVTK